MSSPFESSSISVEQPLVIESELDESQAAIMDDSSLESTTSPSSRWKAALRTGQSAIVMAEILPTNELMRGGLFAAGEVLTRDPVAGGLTIGLSTFAIETAGGLAASGLFTTDRSKKIFEALSSKTVGMHLPMVNKDISLPLDAELSTVSKAGWTFMGGTVVGMALEQREDSTRTVEQNRRYSVVTSAWLGAVTTGLGVLASEGIDIGINDPKSGGFIAAGLIGAAAAGRWAKKKFFSKSSEEEIQE